MNHRPLWIVLGLVAAAAVANAEKNTASHNRMWGKSDPPAVVNNQGKSAKSVLVAVFPFAMSPDLQKAFKGRLDPALRAELDKDADIRVIDPEEIEGFVHTMPQYRYAGEASPGLLKDARELLQADVVVVPVARADDALARNRATGKVVMAKQLSFLHETAATGGGDVVKGKAGTLNPLLENKKALDELAADVRKTVVALIPTVDKAGRTPGSRKRQMNAADLKSLFGGKGGGGGQQGGTIKLGDLFKKKR